MKKSNFSISPSPQNRILAHSGIEARPTCKKLKFNRKSPNSISPFFLFLEFHSILYLFSRNKTYISIYLFIIPRQPKMPGLPQLVYSHSLKILSLDPDRRVRIRANPTRERIHEAPLIFVHILSYFRGSESSFGVHFSN